MTEELDPPAIERILTTEAKGAGDVGTATRNGNGNDEDRNAQEEMAPSEKEEERLLVFDEEQALPTVSNPNSNTSRIGAPSSPLRSKSQYDATGSVIRLRSAIKCTDHFTLKAPSSTVRFRNTDIKVYGQRASQMLLEDKGNGELVARSAKDSSFGVSAVRFWYCLVAVLMTGFLFIFCLQLFLLVFLSLCIDAGLTNKQEFEFGTFFGSLLSLPLWIYGLASAMAIASSFITDTWNGSNFIRSVTSWRDVLASWIVFAVFLGLPLVVMVVALFTGTDKWWEITALVWFSFVFAFYSIFAACAVVFEIRGAFELMRHNNLYKECETKGLLPLLKCMVLNRFINHYSGKVQRQYTVLGSENMSSTDTNLKSRRFDSEKANLYARVTLWLSGKCSLFTIIDDPIRLHTIDEVRDAAPFVTSNTWNLEKLYFRDRNRRFVAVVSGPSAMTEAQVKSSFICSFIGLTLAIITVTALLVWLDANAVAVGLIAALLILCTFPNFRNLYESFELFKEIRSHQEKEKQEGKPGESEAVYQIWENFRVTRASDKLCWTLLFLEVFFFYLYPLVALFMVGNTPIALLFLFSGIITGIRIYCSPVNVITELGPLDKFLDEDNDKGPYGHWRDKARMNLILSKITQGRRRDLWVYCFATIVILFCAIFLGAYTLGASEGKDETNQALNDFYYPSQPGVPYPACTMTRGLSIPGHPETGLVDYTYLSASAYTRPGTTQSWLDAWFGEGMAEDRQDIVNEFRATLPPEEAKSAVTYKLYDFPTLSMPFQIVAIRGTMNGWDTLTDAQLWSAAWISQQVRAIIPYGEMWTPVFENLVNAVSFLQTETLKKISFYKQTTQFVEWLKETYNYTSIHITGHSLGGGLSMITGSQTRTPAIALSGPNAKISRLTFHPPLTVEELNAFTFNIVPNRDPVPRIDDLAQNYQRIECRSPANNPIGCHTATRSLCEVLYTCGSLGRPAFCFCTRKFQYPEPISIDGNRTFDEACPIE